MSPEFVHVCGHPHQLSLDERFRFRVPDDLAQTLQYEQGRVAGGGNARPGDFQRLSFYFVPGPGEKLLLFPSNNIQIAIHRFERPGLQADPSAVRAARDYFYRNMQFVEGDRQNRFVIPEHLREHAGIGDEEREVLLSTHNLWLVMSKLSLAREQDRQGKEALEEIGADILDPVEQPPVERPGDEQQ